MQCSICQTRRSRRFCPGVRGEICSLCCGEEREVTVDCPLDCEFLREGRRHEKAPARNPAEFNPVTASGGASLAYATYLGGEAAGGADSVASITTDAEGYTYVSGATVSSDFPVTTGAYQTSCYDGASGCNGAA